MMIYVASDHNGFGTKKAVIEYLKKAGYQVKDSGDKKLDPDDDFPVFATKAANAVLSSDDKDPRAIMICGSGQGMVMAANRFRGIRAGLGWNRQAAKDIRNDEDSNVLALPAQIYEQDQQLAYNIIEDFLHTPFAKATRFMRRNAELDNL